MLEFGHASHYNAELHQSCDAVSSCLDVRRTAQDAEVLDNKSEQPSEEAFEIDEGFCGQCNCPLQCDEHGVCAMCGAYILTADSIACFACDVVTPVGGCFFHEVGTVDHDLCELCFARRPQDGLVFKRVERIGIKNKKRGKHRRR